MANLHADDPKIFAFLRDQILESDFVSTMDQKQLYFLLMTTNRIPQFQGILVKEALLSRYTAVGPLEEKTSVPHLKNFLIEILRARLSESDLYSKTLEAFLG